MAFVPTAFAPSAFLTVGAGVEDAILEARAGIGRAGITRSGYVIPYPIIMVNDVDVTEYTDADSLRVTLVINDETDTAEFTIPAWTGYIPTPGQTVKIALGHVDNLIFGGQILQQDHQFESDGQPTPWVSVRCIDWGRMFNRRLVTAQLGGMTVSEAVIYVVENFTTGFTTDRVDLTQSAVLSEDFYAFNEEPLSVIRKIANVVKGGCWIHPDRDLAFWGAGGRVDLYAQDPDQLVGGLWSLRQFRHTLDTSQWRTKVICEGGSARTVSPISAGVDLGTYGVPVDHDGQWLFNPVSGTNYARIARMLVSYDKALHVTGPPWAFVAVDKAAGSTSVSINAGAVLTGTGARWMYTEGGSYFVFTSFAAGGPTDLLGGIPSAGNYGALMVDLKAGDRIYQTGSLQTVAALTLSSGVETAVEIGEPVVVRAVAEDPTAQAAIAAIEGGDSDGVYEHYLSDSSLRWFGCEERAAMELDTFKDTLPNATFVTQDMNGMPGAIADMAFTEDGGLVATMVIQKVTFSFPQGMGKGDLEQRVDSWLPTRFCEAGLVKLQKMTDSI